MGPKPAALMHPQGHSRRIDTLPTLAAWPLRSNRSSVLQRNDAMCHFRTHAPQQTTHTDCNALSNHDRRGWERRGKRTERTTFKASCLRMPIP